MKTGVVKFIDCSKLGCYVNTKTKESRIIYRSRIVDSTKYVFTYSEVVGKTASGHSKLIWKILPDDEFWEEWEKATRKLKKIK